MLKRIESYRRVYRVHGYEPAMSVEKFEKINLEKCAAY